MSNIRLRSYLISQTPDCFFCDAALRLRESHTTFRVRPNGTRTKERIVYCRSCHQDYAVSVYLNGGQIGKVHKFRRLLWEEDCRCWYCLCEIPYAEATIDHVVPRISGGPSSIDNLVLACLECNGRKGHKPLNLFLRELQNEIHPRSRTERVVGMLRWVFRNINRRIMPAPVGNVAVSSLWPDREDRIYQKAAAFEQGISPTILHRSRAEIHAIRNGSGLWGGRRRYLAKV